MGHNNDLVSGWVGDDLAHSWTDLSRCVYGVCQDHSQWWNKRAL